MKTIKFRVWIPSLGKMEPIVRLDWLFNEKTKEYDQISLLSKSFSDDNKDMVIMQFTGLTDRVGKDIYEGDRIECIWINVLNGETDTKPITITNIFDFELMAAITSADLIEVIGNVHENPELLSPLS